MNSPGSFALVVTACAIQPCHRLLLFCKTECRTCKIRGGHTGVLAMALETPSHGQRLNLFDSLHCFHRPMAALAGHSGNDMLAVIEVDKIGKVMDLNPLNGPLLLHCFFQLFNLDCLLL